MKTLRQLFRQPLKTAFGILLMSLAVSVLCVCLGQTVAASNAGREISETFVTFAFPSERYGPEADAWLKAYANENPRTVKRISEPDFASAYIPSLLLDNFTSYKHYGDDYTCAPYDSLVVEVTLDEIIRPAWTSSDLGEGPYLIEVTGVIDSYVKAEAGFADNTGYSVRMFFEVDGKESLDAMGLVSGQKYIVYGTDFEDYDYILRNRIANEKDTELAPNFMRGSMTTYHNRNMARIRIGSLYTLIYGEDINMVDTVGFQLKKIAPAPDGAEAFLSSETDGVWQKIIDTVEINSHAFPVVALDALSDMSNFIQKRAQIADGRDFTAEEIASGAKVCIISKTVADKSGISVGDSIDMGLYIGDGSSELPLTNPGAVYCDGENVTSDTYTVVGIYTRTSDWVDSEEDVSAFTPNTVFIPKTSASISEEGGCGGIFRTFILENGTLDEFVVNLVESGYDEALSYRDGGYGDFESNLNGYRNMATRAMVIGLIVYVIILAVFILMFPTRQEKTVWTMDSLGTCRAMRIRHLLVSSLGIFLPGSVLGVGIGLLMWQTVVDTLLGSAKGAFEVEIEISTLALIALIQLVLATAAVAIVAIPATASKSLAHRK